MSHNHYEDVIDTSKKKTMEHHYDDGPDIRDGNKKIEEKQNEISKLEKEKEDLIKEEETKNKKALELSDRIKELQELRDKTQKEIIETTLELNKYCTHERLRTEHRNYPGGYLNRAEHWIDYFCEICGFKVDEKVEYGGFG